MVETVFKNDRYNELDAKAEHNRIYWGAKLTYEVVYRKAFDSSVSLSGSYNTTAAGGFMKVALGKSCYPLGGTGNRYDIYDLVTGLNLYNTYKSDFDSRAGSANAGAAAVYAYTYAISQSGKFDNGLQFSDYLSEIVWDNVARKWQFVVKQDGSYAGINSSNRRIVILYSEPTYLSITNNNAQGLTLRIDSLTVNGQEVATVHYGYGYATAKNGATVETLTPLSAGDLVLAAGQSVKLLFPGSAGSAYTLNGTFVDAEGHEAIANTYYTINDGEQIQIVSSYILRSSPIIQEQQF